MSTVQVLSSSRFRGVILVYMLTAVGLGLGTTSVLVTQFNDEITHEHHGFSENSRAAATKASETSTRAIAAATLTSSELLDLNSSTRTFESEDGLAFLALDQLVAELGEAPSMGIPVALVEDVSRQVENKKALITDLGGLAQACADWKQGWLANAEQMSRRQSQLGEALAGLRSAVADAAGHSRLDVVLALPTSGVSANEDLKVDELVARVRMQHGIGHVASELASLTVLVEMLHAVKDESRLVDLRDNSVAPTIDGLERAIESLKLHDAGLSEHLGTLARGLADSIMGSSSKGEIADDQGVFSVLLEQVRLRDHSQRLMAARRLIEERQARVENEFDLAWSRIGATLSEVANEESARAARVSFIVALIGGALFLILAGGVSKSLRSQILELQATNEDLDRMVEVAERAGRSKDIFLANMSHEIRTPMNGIIGVVSLLEDTPLDPTQKSYLEIMQRSGTALITLINDILDYSKLEAGQMTLESLEFDLVDTVFDVANLFAMNAHQKGLEFFVEIDGDIPARRIGDPARLRQVMSNLVSNAVKFTEKGSIGVHVKRVTEARLRFEVIDSGIGVSAEAQERLFKAFSQADGSTTRRFGGTGLGLSISKHLVEAMQGEIGIISAENVGSTFYFEVHCPAAAKQAPEARADGIPVQLLGFDTMAAEAMKHQVKALGADLVEEGGEVDVERAVLLVDARHLRGDIVSRLASWRRQGGRFVVCTRRVDRQRWESEGTVTLPKPVHPRELAAALKAKPERVIHRSRTVSQDEPNPSARGPESSPGGVADSHDAAESNALRVLIAEDNPINQRIARAMLEKMGCDVALAENGQEAVLALQAEAYDLVFMDCQMPVMDGFEATRQIRALGDKERAEVQIVALTANTMQGDRERCLDAGMNDYLRKPIEKALLQAVVDRMRPEGLPLSR